MGSRPAGLLVAAIETPLIATADFAPDRELWIVLNWVIGVGFVLVGIYAWMRRPENLVGALMVATGFAWFISVLGHTEPAPFFTVGPLFDSLFVGVAIHLLPLVSVREAGVKVDRWLVGAVYAAVTVGYIPYIVFWDPAAMGCAGCPDNVLLITPDASVTETAGDVLAVVGVTLLLATSRASPESGAARLPRSVVRSPRCAAAGGPDAAARDAAGAQARRVAGGDRGRLLRVMIPFGLVPYLFAGLARAQMLRGGAVGRLVASLGEPLGSGAARRAVPRSATHPGARVLAARVGAVRRREGPPRRAPGSGLRAGGIPVSLEGRPVAAIVHDPLVLEDPDLVDAVGAAAALALETGRLDAELRARWRSCGVEGEAARGRPRGTPPHGAKPPWRPATARRSPSICGWRARRAGIPSEPRSCSTAWARSSRAPSRSSGSWRPALHPAVLTDRGLEQAVKTLATRAPLPVDVDARIGEVPEAVELAAYFVISEALTNVAKYAAADAPPCGSAATTGASSSRSRTTASGRRSSARVGLRGLGDRLSALGGKLEVYSAPHRNDREGEHPCE